MSMKDWAAKEIALDRDDASTDNEYYNLILDNVQEAYDILLNAGHSGMSIQIAKELLNRLIDGKPLTEIDLDDPDIWNLITEEDDGTQLYQCSRMSSLFKYAKDDQISYKDNNRVVCMEGSPTYGYGFGFITNLIHKMFPIQNPYYPTTRTEFVVFVRSFEDDGGVECIDVLYALKPDGSRIEINKTYHLSGV